MLELKLIFSRYLVTFSTKFSQIHKMFEKFFRDRSWCGLYSKAACNRERLLMARLRYFNQNLYFPRKCFVLMFAQNKRNPSKLKKHQLVQTFTRLLNLLHFYQFNSTNSKHSAFNRVKFPV